MAAGILRRGHPPLKFAADMPCGSIVRARSSHVLDLLSVTHQKRCAGCQRGIDATDVNRDLQQSLFSEPGEGS